MNPELQMEELITSLRKAIERERRFFVAAKVDPNFDPVRTHIDALLNRLTQEAKVKAEKEILSVQLALDEMKDWHAQETAPSEYDSAMNTIAKARENLRTGSYFGYLDAQALAGKAEEKARNAVDAQKAHMNAVIDKLKGRAHQLWTDIENLGEEAEKHALMELETHLESARAGWDYAEVETHASYCQSESSLRESLRFAELVIEKTGKALGKRQLGRLNIAFLLALMWPLLIPPIISLAIWDWGNDVYGWGAPGPEEFLCPFMWITLPFWSPIIGLAEIFAYKNHREKIKQSYGL